MKSKIQIKEVVVDMRGKKEFKIKKAIREFVLMPLVQLASPVKEKVNPEKNPKFKIVKKVYRGGLPGNGKRT